jgi:hypothetical protein
MARCAFFTASPKGVASRAQRRWLAFTARPANINLGRLAVDEPLANRVRSGRKQP